MFHGVIQKIKLAQFFLRHGVDLNFGAFGDLRNLPFIFCSPVLLKFPDFSLTLSVFPGDFFKFPDFPTSPDCRNHVEYWENAN